jgi:chromosome segregation ATPase
MQPGKLSTDPAKMSTSKPHFDLTKSDWRGEAPKNKNDEDFGSRSVGYKSKDEAQESREDRNNSSQYFKHGLWAPLSPLFGAMLTEKIPGIARELIKENNELVIKIMSLCNRISKLLATVNQLKQEQLGLINDKEYLSEELSLLSEKLSVVSTDLMQTKQQLTTLAYTNSNQDRQLEQYLAKLEEANAQIITLNQQLTEQVAANTSLVQQVNNQKTQAIHQANQLSAAGDYQQQLQEELTQVKSDLAAVKQQLAATLSFNAELAEKLTILDNKIRHGAQEQSAQVADLKILLLQLRDKVKQEVSIIKDDYNVLAQQVGLLLNLREQQQAESRQLRAQQQAAQQELAKFHQQVTNTVSQHENLVSLETAARQEIADLQLKLNGREKLINNLNMVLKIALAAYKQAQSRIQQLTRENQLLKKQLKNFKKTHNWEEFAKTVVAKLESMDKLLNFINVSTTTGAAISFADKVRGYQLAYQELKGILPFLQQALEAQQEFSTNS